MGLVRGLVEETAHKAGGYRPERLGGPDGCDFDSAPFFYGYHGKSGRTGNPMHDRNTH
jgi:hypothetical protein